MDSHRIQNKYTGETASQYKKKRAGSEKWSNEQDAVELLLSKALSESDVQSLLDIPVGTGRFFNIYSETELDVNGVDISEDMLEQSMENADQIGINVSLYQGNILDLETINTDPDIVVCVRLLNWFSFEEVIEVLNNINELGAEYAIVGIRTQPMEKRKIKERIWLLQAQVISNILNLRLSRKNDINIHPRDEFRCQVSSSGFNIENRILVDVGTSPLQFGSEYYIYLMKVKCGNS